MGVVAEVLETGAAALDEPKAALLHGSPRPERAGQSGLGTVGISERVEPARHAPCGDPFGTSLDHSLPSPRAPGIPGATDEAGVQKHRRQPWATAGSVASLLRTFVKSWWALVDSNH
jgi:hypothetical protein